MAENSQHTRKLRDVFWVRDQEFATRTDLLSVVLRLHDDKEDPTDEELRANAREHFLMDLHVPPELEAKLSRLATASGRNIPQVVFDLLTSSVDHDEWFRREIERARTSAREGH